MRVRQRRRARGCRLVGRLGRGCAMPGRPIDIAHHSRKRDVRSSLLVHRRPLLDCRTDEWMTKAKQRPVDLDESRVDRRPDRRCRYAGRGHDLGDHVAIVERGDQQQPLRVLRKVIRARCKLTLETGAQWKEVGQPLARCGVIADRRRSSTSARGSLRLRGG